MLNLNEEWKKAYATYLEEQEAKFDDDVDSFLSELTEAQAECRKGFDVLQEYYHLYGVSEGVLKEDSMEGRAPAGTEYSAPLERNYPDKKYSVTFKNDDPIRPKTMQDTLGDILKYFNPEDTGRDAYKPVATYTVQTIKDMKFPGNVIFFFQQILRWIKNIALYFIQKIINLVHRITGHPELEREMKPEALKLNFEKAKQIEQISTSVGYGKENQPIQIRTLDPDSVARYDALTEGSIFDTVRGDFKTPDIKKERVIVSIDISKDLLNLQELMQHFYDLFENSYGSNNEKLFETDDLETILEVFKKTLEKVKDGTVANTYTIGGGVASAASISADKVRDNVILTSKNIDQLKNAYMLTSNKVKQITKIITSKEMSMITDVGVNGTFLSSATYTQIKRVLDSTKIRLKDAAKLEKDLITMQKKYNAINDKLAKFNQAIPQLSNVTYSTIYDREIVNLVNAGKYMTDIITLRLSGLALYIQELREVQSTLKMLASFNKKGR